MTFTDVLARLADPAVPQVLIVALGDSITELTWHTRGQFTWVEYLQEALFERHGRGKVRMLNAGRCGDTAHGALARLERDVLRFTPDLVIISFGMNDAASGGPAGLPRFREATVELIRRCRDAGAAVLLRTPNPILLPVRHAALLGMLPGQEMPDGHQGRYAQALVEIGAAEGCPVVDHYTLWKAAAYPPLTEIPNNLWLRMSDEVHPGALGHRIFYRELAPLFGLPLQLPWEE